MEQLQVLSVCVIMKHLFNKQETKGESSYTLPGPGCNPSTRIMNCMCAWTCAYFPVMVAAGACASEVIRECFQLSDVS